MSRPGPIISDIIETVRVIGGAYRGRKLRAVEGLDVRPTSDRLRETLFNILAPRIKGSRFLDLCAGSGAVGIEAVSRGAGQVKFIDSSRRACSVIEANLRALGIGNEAAIINRDAAAALKQVAKAGEEFDVVFFDPPYASGIYDQVMALLDGQLVLSAGAIVIAEHRAKTPPKDQYGKLRVYREVRQGESALAFYAATGD